MPQLLKDIAEILATTGGWGLAALMWWERRQLQNKLDEQHQAILAMTEKLVAVLTEFNIKTKGTD